MEEGIVNAREAAFGVLREIATINRDGFEEFADQIDGFTIRTEQEARNLVSLIDAADTIGPKLENMVDILGI